MGCDQMRDPHGSLTGKLIEIRPRAGTIQLSRGRTALICEQDGEVKPKCEWQGLYVYDTRILGRYLWLMNGKAPEFSCGSNIEQNSWIGYYIQAPKNCPETPMGECDPLQQTIELRLSRRVGEGMHEDVYLTNHTQITTTIKLEVRYDYEFVSQDEVKGGRKQHGRLHLQWTTPEPGVWEQMATYDVAHYFSHQGNRGVARFDRGMKLRIENASSPPRYRNNRLVFRVELAPHAEWHVCLSWIAYVDNSPLPLPESCAGEESEWDRRRRVFFESATGVSTRHCDDLSATVYRVMRRAAVDIGDLRMFDLDSPGGITVAAGIPTYLELFGRDTEIASWQAGMMSPTTPSRLSECLLKASRERDE